MNVQACQCRWCKRPVALTEDDEKHREHLSVRVDRHGYEALTEDEQALVLYGPLCGECVKEAG